MAHEKPEIIEGYTVATIDDSKLGLERLTEITASLLADVGVGEKIFYERCTVCHGPREVSHYTQNQWKAITPSMFPRAGLDANEADLVMEFLMKNASDATN